MSHRRELEAATEAALAAGAVLVHHRAAPLAVRRKAGGEIVTAADLESDALIRRLLQRAFPADAIFSEEAPDTRARLGRARVWIVDPLDSTSDYVAGGDEFAVSIGLVVDGRPVVGVVHAPARDQLFAGAVDAGVTLNGEPVAPTVTGSLQRARITVSAKEHARGLRALAPDVPLQAVASMAHKLARVAAGLDDGVVSLKPRKEWGTCAGVALVLAGGGRATLLDGSEIAFNRAPARAPRGMVAAGAPLHPELARALRRVAERRAHPVPST